MTLNGFIIEFAERKEIEQQMNEDFVDLYFSHLCHLFVLVQYWQYATVLLFKRNLYNFFLLLQCVISTSNKVCRYEQVYSKLGAF